MCGKVKDSRGFSLVEMLCATVILVLLGLMINTGLNLAVKSYQDITVQEELELLLSTLSDALSDDLRYAKNIQTGADNRLVNYHSERYNMEDTDGTTTLKVENDGQLYANTYRMVSSGAYGSGGAYVIGKDKDTPGLVITYDKGEGLFTVDLTVRQIDGELSAHTQFTVRCLNPHTAK